MMMHGLANPKCYHTVPDFLKYFKMMPYEDGEQDNVTRAK